MTAIALRRVIARSVTIVLSAALLFGMLLLAWVGARAYLAQQHLRDAQRAASEVQGSLARDTGSAAESVARLSSDTAAARDLTSDPLWQLAEGLPWIGLQLAAVSTTTESIDELVSSGLEPLAESAASVDLSLFAPRNGAIDVAPLVELREPSAAAAASAAEAAAAMSDVDTAGLVGVLRSPVEQATELITTVANATDALARATELAPAMLGGEEPRDYLVLLQNNAEWRSLGGIAGSVIVVHTNNGRITLSDAASARDLTNSRGSEPIGTVSDEVRSLYGEDPASYMHNVTQVPDFALSGELAREIWSAKRGLDVDGVIAMDPVALSYLLRATGPVTLPTSEELTAENAVQLLLNDVYFRYPDAAEQDAFFAQATEAVFGALTAGDAEPAALIEALAQAGSEGRLLIWSERDEEQAVLEGTTLAGPLPVTNEDATQFGVYVNDGTGSKMDYYARLETELGWCSPAESGLARAALSVTVRSEAPEDAATSLPGYITGGDISGVEKGLTRTVAYLYLPQGSTVAGVDATAGSLGSGIHQERQVVTWETTLEPGEEATYSVVVETPYTELLELVRTPTLFGVDGDDVTAACGVGG